MLKDADLGTEMTVLEFEEAAEEDGLVNDLLDRDDLQPGDFIRHAIIRVNSSGNAGGHKWVKNGDRVVLIRAEFIAPLQGLHSTRHALEVQVNSLEQYISTIIRVASR